jgi:hypothetical protein
LFEYLPLAAIVDGKTKIGSQNLGESKISESKLGKEKIICVHAGIGPKV